MCSGVKAIFILEHTDLIWRNYWRKMSINLLDKTLPTFESAPLYSLPLLSSLSGLLT